MNTLIFIPTDVKSRHIGGATQPLGLRWGFETTSSVLPLTDQPSFHLTPFCIHIFYS